jgi:hypothetical protein
MVDYPQRAFCALTPSAHGRIHWAFGKRFVEPRLFPNSHYAGVRCTFQIVTN